MLWLDTSTIWSRRSMKRGNKPAVKVSLLFTPIPGVDCLYQSSPPGNGHTRVLLRGTSRSGIRSSPASVPEGCLANPRLVWPCTPWAPFQSRTLLLFFLLHPPSRAHQKRIIHDVFSVLENPRRNIGFYPIIMEYRPSFVKMKKGYNAACVLCILREYTAGIVFAYFYYYYYFL